MFLETWLPLMGIALTAAIIFAVASFLMGERRAP
jgi:hypothetical protein